MIELLSELKFENMNYNYTLLDYSTLIPDNSQSFIRMEDDHRYFLRFRIGEYYILMIGITKGGLELCKESLVRHSCGSKTYFMDVQEKIEKEVYEGREN